MGPAVRVHRAFAVVALTLALSSAAFAQTRTARVQIDNFAKVSNTYYRGAQPVGRDYADLAALGVKTIINLTSEDAQPGEQAAAEKAGMKYIHIPMDTHRVPTTAEIEKFLALTNDAASQPVYVHCVGGRHRTGVMTAVYRMNHDGITGAQAFNEMKQFKYGADFLHPEFKQFVTSQYKPATAAAAVNANAQQQQQQ